VSSWGSLQEEVSGAIAAVSELPSWWWFLKLNLDHELEFMVFVYQMTII